MVVPADITGKLAQPSSPSEVLVNKTSEATTHHEHAYDYANIESTTATRQKQQLTLTLRGIGAFSSPRKARVFYAPPIDTDGKLLAFANAIRKVFEDAGLITEERALTLHATLANMAYAKSPKMGKNRKRGGSRTVDGTDVIEHFNGIGSGMGGGQGYVWARDVV
ncbi:MAG: hypothetical protein M1823_007828, partial [Watsoniomyces obsoletus]